MALTLVSAIVRDSDGQNWVRGTWKLEFIPTPSNPNIGQYVVDGVTPLSSSVLSQSGVMDSNGSFALSVYDNTSVTPIGSSWKLTVCPLSSAECGFYVFSAAGASLDISGALTFLLPAPRFFGVYPNYGYADGEVILSNKPGSTYYNVVQQVQKYYNDQTLSWYPGGTNTMGILNGAQDMNTITTAGTYYLPDGISANGPNPPHTWDSRGGVLEVFVYTSTGIAGTSPTYIFQRFQAGNDSGYGLDEFFIRWYVYTGGVLGWVGWRYFSSDGAA